MSAAPGPERHGHPHPLGAEAPRALVIFVGLPASGKGNLFRRYFAATHRHVSKDLMRNVRNRDQYERELIAEALTQGQSIVVDNGSATAADRAWLIALGRAHGAGAIGYHFDSRARECLERNATRVGRPCVPKGLSTCWPNGSRWLHNAGGFDYLYRMRLVAGRSTAPAAASV